MHANQPKVVQTAKLRNVWLGTLLTLILTAFIPDIQASESVLRLELNDIAKEETSSKENEPNGGSVKETKPIPEPSFAAALAAGTGILLTVNYWRRRLIR